MVHALPQPIIVARLVGPTESCVIRYRPTDSEAGDITSARCGTREQVLAWHYHGDNVQRLSRCSVMLTIEGVRFPRLFHVGNCRGALQVREVGKEWTQQLLAGSRIAPERLDRVIYYPSAHRPGCYRVSIWFTQPTTATNTSFSERATVRCAVGAEQSARKNEKPL